MQRSGSRVALLAAASFIWILIRADVEPSIAQDAFPYELKTGRELAITGTGAILLVSGIAVDHHKPGYDAEQLEALSHASIHGIDRSATTRWSPSAARASNVLVAANLIAPMSLLLTDRGREEPWTLTTMYAETVLLNIGVVQFVKSITVRTRPFVYNDDPRIPTHDKLARDARRSFPSGHTANAFAGATFLGVVHQRLYPDSTANGWIWAGSLTVATATGVFRYAAGKHFPTDIVAGAALGALIGWLVPYLHEIDPADPGGSPAKMHMVTFSVGF